MSSGKASIEIEKSCKNITDSVAQEFKSRGVRASNELMNAKNLILRGSRSGRTYRVPGTRKTYTASAPGEAPAVRTGTYRDSWKQKNYSEGDSSSTVVHAAIESTEKTEKGNHLLGDILENGIGKMAPRPHFDAIIEKAEPQIKRIFEEPYTK